MSLGKKNEVRVKGICHMSFLEIHLSLPLQRKEFIEALNKKKKYATHKHSLLDIPLCSWLDEYQRFGTTDVSIQ